jgi:hypothetical protein
MRARWKRLVAGVFGVATIGVPAQAVPPDSPNLR